MANFEELKSKSNLTWGAIFAWSVFLAWTVFYVTSSYHTLNRNDSQIAALTQTFNTELSFMKEEIDRIEDEESIKFNDIREEIRTSIEELELKHDADIEYFNGRVDRKVATVEDELKHHAQEDH